MRCAASLAPAATIFLGFEGGVVGHFPLKPFITTKPWYNHRAFRSVLLSPSAYARSNHVRVVRFVRRTGYRKLQRGVFQYPPTRSMYVFRQLPEGVRDAASGKAFVLVGANTAGVFLVVRT